MTTFEKRELKCAVCGMTSAHTVLMSTNSYGMDLDLRPRGMQRTTLGGEIQVCPHCKYVSYDLEEKVKKEVKEYVLGPTYDRSVSGGVFFGATSNTYVNLREIALIEGDTKKAFYATLKAAWMADDAVQNDDAREFRKIAIKLLNLVPVKNMDQDTRMLLMADLFRRIGDFKRTIKITSTYVPENKDLIFLYQYERKLAENGDANVHQVPEH